MTESTFEVHWTRLFVGDLEAIIDYVAEHSGPGQASNLYAKLSKAIENLRQFPEKGRVVPELGLVGIHQFREAIEPPYRILFRLDGNKIALVGIFDARRDLESLLVDRALRF